MLLKAAAADDAAARVPLDEASPTMSLLACPKCNRHVRTSELACPFCCSDIADATAIAVVSPVPTKRLSRAALLALAAGGMGAAACNRAADGAGSSSGTGSQMVEVPIYGAPIPSGSSADAGHDIRAIMGGAERAATAWLALVDAVADGESRPGRSTLFQDAGTSSARVRKAVAARAPVGTLRSRTLEANVWTSTPKGAKAVVTFHTSFDRKEAAVEAVTMMRDAASSWRVVQYLIR